MSRNLSNICVAAALALVVTAVGAPQTLAAQPCGIHDALAKTLKTKYQETRRILGIINARNVMEIFMSPQGTWTVVVTDTSGTSCITAAGEGWQEIPIVTAGLDS